MPSLDEEFNQYQGQSVLVPGQPEYLRGECFMWFDFVLHDVYQLPYFYAEGAIDIWNSPGWLLNHFDKITDGSIKKGDIVIFNQSVGSIYGHVDVAMQDGTVDSFQGSDQNWSGNKTVHLVNHTGRQYVLGSLRLKGSDMSDIADLDFVRTVCVGFTDLQPETNQNFMNNVGLSKSDVVKNFLNYSQSQNLRLDAEAYRSGGKAAVNKQAVIDYINKNLQ
jgi:hypothetical protein